MTLGAYLALGGGATGLILAVLVWYYRREAQRATTDKDAAVAGLAAAQIAAAAERARLQGVPAAIRIADERYMSAVEDWLRTQHPELGPEYLAVCVRLASTAAGAGDASVPVPPTAGPRRGGSS